MSSEHSLVTNYNDDWKHVDGVQLGGYEFGPDRQFTVAEGTLVAPETGVAMLKTNPDHKEVVVAASTYGYEVTDMAFNVWASTLCHGLKRIRVKPGDWLVLCNGERWRITSARKICDGAQWRCMCREDVLYGAT